MDEKIEAERLRGSVEYWKQVIYVQTHFNDMCIRTRWVGLTVVSTLLAGAGVAMAQYPEGMIPIFSWEIHISTVLLFIASLVSLALWQLDRKYYYKMLLATVEHAEPLETRLNLLLKDFIGERTLTQSISAKVSRGTASGVVDSLYCGLIGVPLIICMFSLFVHTDAPLGRKTDATSYRAIEVDPK